MKVPLLALAALGLAAPAVAQDPLAPLPPGQSPVQQPEVSIPPQLPPAVQQPVASVPIPRDWREVFIAIRTGNWASAQAGIATLPGILNPVARAELFLARGSPVVSLQQIEALLAEAPELPQAEQLARLAATRGARTAPFVVPRKQIVSLGTPPIRVRARPVAGEPAADQLRAALDPYLEANDAVSGEQLLVQSAPFLGPEARAEAAQRVAWVYYRIGRDEDARRLADSWRAGANGDWGAHAAWVSGLASWRLNDCEAASRSFREVASLTRERELSAGAHYWAARAEQACRRPHSVAPLLRAAARSPESFYGVIAREALGIDWRLPANRQSHAAAVEQLINVRRAVELANIGDRALAEEFLRHQARIGSPFEHQGLIELAKRLDLAGAQYWLANNGQRGAVSDPADRYPNPRWAPLTGWRVDPALALAHIMQESAFRAEAVSPAGAVGLMQVLPGTAQDMARLRGLPYSRPSLSDPVINLEFGQSFIERLRGMSATGGQLPKIIAAYNAGPLPVSRWAINDRGDPLLWIESIPYWETRFYVPAVLRNMWVYQGLNNADAPTLKALVQHRWPTFPTSPTRLAH